MRAARAEPRRRLVPGSRGAKPRYASGAVALLLALGGCAPTVVDPWQDRGAPAGPCFEANLADGLDAASTSELHAVFACLNGGGALDGYVPLDAALDASTRDGSVGAAVVALVEAAPDAGLSLRGALASLAAMLDDPSGLHVGVEVALELVYAAPWSALGSTVPLNDVVALDGGALVPMLDPLGATAGALLDDDLAPLTRVADALRSPLLRRVAWTAASAATSDDPALAPLGSGWAPALAEALDVTATPSNDRWPEASGDSLRDVVDRFVLGTAADGRPIADLLAEPLLAVLSDADVRAGGRDVLAAADLDRVVPGLVYLASVDVDGGTLTADEDSALVALLRLLDAGNTEVRCGVDLGWFDIDVSLGNLSVSLLGALADLDDDTAVSGVGLLGAVLGTSLSSSVLGQVADTGVCPTIDRQLVSDLRAVDRLSDAGAAGLLRVLLKGLEAARAQLASVVDLASVLHVYGLVEPLEEVVRDLDGTRLVDAIVAFAPTLADPYRYHDADVLPSGVDPLDVDAAFDLASALLAAGDDGRTPLEALSGPVTALLGHDGTWAALHNLTPMLADPDARLPTLGAALAEALAEDPDLAAADTLADVLETPSVVRPALLVADTDAVRAALAGTELTRPGPLPFTAALITGGTLDALLDTLRALATLLPETPE